MLEPPWSVVCGFFGVQHRCARGIFVGLIGASATREGFRKLRETLPLQKSRSQAIQLVVGCDIEESECIYI